MPAPIQTISRSFIALMIAIGVSSAGTAPSDLSKYRNFQFGANLTTVLKQANKAMSQVRLVHSRPALIQELEWRPSSSTYSLAEPSKDIVFSFYNGELFQIVVNYDHYDTEGLTSEDLVEAISASYGPAVKPASPSKGAVGAYGEQDDIVAEWQDSQHCFYLLRASSGASFRLIGIAKKLAGPAEEAMTEARRLDAIEAPQREAQRVANEGEAERLKLEKARLMNKPRFKP
jgi:hypothetical protein